MTPRQRACYDAICTFWREHGYGPSYVQISAALGYKETSKGTVHTRVQMLIRDGWVEHRPHRAHSLRPRELPPIELVRACESLLASIVRENEVDGELQAVVGADALGEIELILAGLRESGAAPPAPKNAQ